METGIGPQALGVPPASVHDVVEEMIAVLAERAQEQGRTQLQAELQRRLTH